MATARGGRIGIRAHRGERLTETTYIHRVNTIGGLAPMDACAFSNVGARQFIPYEADYIFYKAT